MRPPDKDTERMAVCKTVGLARQIRIPVERDGEGNDITPDIKTFLEKGSRRRPKPVRGEEPGKDIQETRSPAKKSKHNLALVRKFAYNILRIAILYGDCAEIMTEAMDDFSDDLLLRKKYVFSGIESFY